ncbi:MAG: CarD family transcriptional regulator [Lachnospiraceae bacterium]|nr:CarD family transcriptional regulator [Lachnospiraceae bacterium]
MFNVGEFVVFGTDGVCMVENVGALEMEGVAKDKQYYTLTPVGKKGSNRIFAPVDGKRVVMRKVLTVEEARDFVESLDDIGRLKIPDERKREDIYKAVLQSCDHIKITELIKEMYARRSERAAVGKKLPSVDERYFTAAENSLYSELGLSLNMEKDEIRSFMEKSAAR